MIDKTKEILKRMRKHEDNVNKQFRKAEKGGIIDLTAMMIEKEKIDEELEKIK